MAMESLLYISESKIKPRKAKSELYRIIATARAFNPTVGITGALIYTGTHFAQVIEGDETAINELIAKIARDSRHGEISIVARDPLTKRRFSDWSMAYNGPSQFVSENVTRLLNEPSPAERSLAAGWLVELIEEFSGFRNPPGVHRFNFPTGPSDQR